MTTQIKIAVNFLEWVRLAATRAGASINVVAAITEEAAISTVFYRTSAQYREFQQQVEDLLGTEIPDNVFEGFQTVGDLKKYLATKGVLE